MNNNGTRPLIVIAGPTGVGKTDLSIRLAKKFDGEIINGDSMQVYRGLDIGTGKIRPEEMEEIPHYLIDSINVDQRYDVSHFKQEASPIIENIIERGKIPFLVGGTGLYLEGLIYEMTLGHSHDPIIRQEIQEELENQGPQKLWEKLREKDPQAAEQIPYQNGRRVVRALEVIALTGKPFSEQDDRELRTSRYNECLLFLDRPRDQLYQRIDQRVLQMVKDGLEDEAKKLYHDSLGKDYQSFKGIGYKEWQPYFEGECQREEVIAMIQQNSRRYAKRQLTWFRNRFENSHWIDMSDFEKAFEQVTQLVKGHLDQ